MKQTDEQNYGAIQVFSVHHREVSRSTNLEAIELAEQGFPEGTVIVADTQTSGSGRRGRKWASPKGNLYFSILLREQLQITATYFIASLSVGSTIEELFEMYIHEAAKPQVQYKWPNDVLVHGKKISGTLINAKTQGTTLAWVVCGIGVNMYCPPSYATSLSFYIPQLQLSNLEFLDMILKNFSKLSNTFAVAGLTQLRNLWIKKAYMMGQEVRITTNTNTVYEGNFVDIDTSGAMILESGGRIITINHGEML